MISMQSSGLMKLKQNNAQNSVIEFITIPLYLQNGYHLFTFRQFIQSINMSGQPVIGLMDSAYFVSKNQLLRWINQTLELNLIYLQDLGSGSIYCQLIDAYHRQTIPMAKINWKTKFEYEFVNNLRYFQKGLVKIGATKKIDVNRLAKAKYQDNLQTIQWLKKYLQLTATPLQQYDATRRRNNQTLYSHHSQKIMFSNKLGRVCHSSRNSEISFSCTMKKDSFKDKQNHKANKIEKIKAILNGEESSIQKIELISELVNVRNFADVLEQKDLNSASKDSAIEISYA